MIVFATTIILLFVVVCLCCSGCVKLNSKELFDVIKKACEKPSFYSPKKMVIDEEKQQLEESRYSL